MILRPALATEAADLAAIHAEAFGPPERWSAEVLALMVEAAGGFGILALSGLPPFGDEPLGFVLGRAIAGESEVLTLAVRPKARRMGIGPPCSPRRGTRLTSVGRMPCFLRSQKTTGLRSRCTVRPAPHLLAVGGSITPTAPTHWSSASTFLLDEQACRAVAKVGHRQ